MVMTEVWKPLQTKNPIFEGYYKISNKGRLKCRPVLITRSSWNGSLYTYLKTERILALRHSKKSDLLFTSIQKNITDDNGDTSIHKETIYIHKAVALAFVPNPKPGQYTQVAHRNDETKDNFYLNLMWCSQSFFSLRNMRKNPALRNTLKKANIKSGYYESLKTKHTKT